MTTTWIKQNDQKTSSYKTHHRKLETAQHMTNLSGVLMCSGRVRNPANQLFLATDYKGYGTKCHVIRLYLYTFKGCLFSLNIFIYSGLGNKFCNLYY